MALFSAGGGDDRLQVATAVFAIVISLAVTMLIPVVAPSSSDAGTGYSWEQIYLEKQSLEAYTGQSMTNMTPWALTGVYTPWSIDQDMNIDPETGWVYGESVAYNYKGTDASQNPTSGIYLDPDHKSSTLITQDIESTTQTVTVKEWWATSLINPNNLSLIGWAATALGISVSHEEERPLDLNYWNFTGYRYEFDPMLKIDWSDPNAANYSKPSQTDAKMSVIWYKNQYSTGLSNGLILYRNLTDGLVANLELTEILANYDTLKGFSTQYQLDFNGVYVYINIRFDADVIAGNVDLTEAWEAGRWTMAVTAKSMDNWMNIEDSNSLSTSTASLLDTYIQIFTLSMPEVPLEWSVVLWLICILPLELVLMLYLTRFGIAGIGAGVLGNVFLGVLGGLV